jgi:hypothetical protein
MRFMAILASVAAVAAVAVGCGGGDSDELTKAEFTKQADAICAKSTKQAQANFGAALRKVADKGKSSNEEKAAEVGEEVLLPYYQSKVDGLESLEPPSADEDRIAAIVGALEKGIDEGGENPEDIIPGLPGIEEANEMAKKYGLEDCSRP